MFRIIIPSQFHVRAPSSTGGDDALTVYSVGDVVPVGPTPSPVHAVEPSGNDYTGLECFVDERDGSRAMEVRMPTNADTEMSAQVRFLPTCLDHLPRCLRRLCLCRGIILVVRLRTHIQYRTLLGDEVMTLHDAS